MIIAMQGDEMKNARSTPLTGSMYPNTTFGVLGSKTPYKQNGGGMRVFYKMSVM
jgi:hypothetical protein